MLNELLIGTASQRITPAPGCQLAGFDARKGTATSVHDQLYSRTIVLDDGATQIALVSLEVIGVSRDLARRIRAEVTQRTGIPSANVIIAATHTHCGPVTFNHFFNPGQVLDENYLAQLVIRTAASVELAFMSRSKRRLRTGFAEVHGIAVNRRTADGLPTDPSAGVLLVEELDGTPTAVVINFACHPTVLGPNTLAITGDFPYYTGQQLRSRLGQVETLFFNGAEGDISIGHRSDLSAVGVIAPFRTFAKAEELGSRLADAVIAGFQQLSLANGVLAVASRTVPLPLKTYPPLAAMRSRREQAIADASTLEARQCSLYSRIEEYYAGLYEAQPGPEPKTLPAELIAIRIGDTAMISFPGEVFIEIALEIRRRSPFPTTMFLGLANDYIGYIPTADATASAGYEVVAARVAAEAAAILTDGCVELLHELCD